MRSRRRVSLQCHRLPGRGRSGNRADLPLHGLPVHERFVISRQHCRGGRNVPPCCAAIRNSTFKTADRRDQTGAGCFARNAGYRALCLRAGKSDHLHVAYWHHRATGGAAALASRSWCQSELPWTFRRGRTGIGVTGSSIGGSAYREPRWCGALVQSKRHDDGRRARRRLTIELDPCPPHPDEAVPTAARMVRRAHGRGARQFRAVADNGRRDAMHLDRRRSSLLNGIALLDVMLDGAGVPDGVDLAWRAKHYLGLPVPAATLATVNLAHVIAVVEFIAAEFAETPNRRRRAVQRRAGRRRDCHGGANRRNLPPRRVAQ